MSDEEVDKREPTVGLELASVQRREHLWHRQELGSAHPSYSTHLKRLDLVVVWSGHHVLCRLAGRELQIVKVSVVSAGCGA